MNTVMPLDLVRCIGSTEVFVVTRIDYVRREVDLRPVNREGTPQRNVPFGSLQSLSKEELLKPRSAT